MRVALHTLGCRVNTADTMALQEAFREAGCPIVDKDDAADVYVLNTCTVTHVADSDARKLARRFKRNNPDAQVVVTGCYAQTSPADLRAIPEIDLVIGNDGKPQLVGTVLARVREKPGKSSDPRVLRGPQAGIALDPRFVDNKRTRGRRWQAAVRPARSHITAMPESRTRPFLKVQDGCDYTCAFCIIPTARGVSRSTPVAEVLAQALQYAELGATELVLTGIHLGHWGRDLTPRRPFWRMVEELLAGIEADGRIRRVRLGSVEPNEVTEELVALIGQHPLLCEHLHIPLQSGDDDVLRRMRRLYTAQEYADVVAQVRAALPSAAIGADVLVGHPGEDDAAFLRTQALIEALDLTYLHVFPWSARKGTAAAEMPDPPPEQARSARVQTLVKLSAAKRHFFHRRLVGQRLEVVVLERQGGAIRGLSRNYVPIRLPATADDGNDVAGQIQTWELTEAGAERCLGRRAV